MPFDKFGEAALNACSNSLHCCDSDMASSSSTQYIEYYQSTSATGIADFQASLTDYAGIDVELTPEEKASVPDLALVPMTAYAIIPSYNLLEVQSIGYMGFSYEVIADIYLGTSCLPSLYIILTTSHAHPRVISRNKGIIKKWNDGRIKAINPDFAPYLPDTDICVLYLTEPSIITEVFTTVLISEISLSAPMTIRFVRFPFQDESVI